ncbi:site-specific integrase [Bacillus sp. UNC438CL73TsuS30]|uniref:site-specific integrase n=1 Tax=Bacillus sp. UNC438CL73TsuS30 TaxID=1340434 RepID=UPI00047A7457|nr:site-specific integrase [Bacillus sp. UNC438CL73TsuS30]
MKQNKETTYDVQPLRTKEEIEEMKWSLRRHCSERDYFLFVFGINTGLRVSDILPLKVGDIRGKTHVNVVQQKNGKPRRISLKQLAPEIDNYTKGMSDEDYLFPSRKGNKPISETQAYRALVKAGEGIDRTDIGTHTMRKTFGYHHYKRNKDIAILQEIFSHAAPSITKRYIGITQDEIDESIDFVL